MLKSKVALVGGSGFIGFHLRELLLQHHYEVEILDIKHPGSHFKSPIFVQLDLLDKDAIPPILNGGKYSAIINLAAITNDDSSEIADYLVNFQGCKNLLDAIEAIGFRGRFIQVSTQYVQKPKSKSVDIQALEPMNAYGMSKLLAEEIILQSNYTNSLILRPTNVWGTFHPSFPRGFWNVVKKGFYFHPKKEVVRSYGYVESVCSQIQSFMELDEIPLSSKIFYVGDDPIDSYDWTNGFSQALTGKKVKIVPVWLLYFVALVGELGSRMGLTVPINLKRFRSMTTDYIVDMEPTWATIGKNSIDLQKCIEKTSNWFLSKDEPAPDFVFVSPIVDSYGAARTLAGIVSKLIANKRKVEVWYPRDSEPNNIFLELGERGVKLRKIDLPVLRRKIVYQAHFSLTLLFYLAYILRLRRISQSERYSNSIFHIFTSASALSAFMVEKKRRVISVHEYSKNKFEKFLLKNIFRRAGYPLIFASGQVQAHYELEGEVIYSGGDIMKFNVPQKNFFTPGEELRIICVGRITESKGQRYFVESLIRLNEEYPKFTALIIGQPFESENSYLTELKELIEKNLLQKKIIFLGQIENPEVHFSRSHVLVLPSVQPEAFGKVVIEGMASRNVVIATNIGGPLEIINQGVNGFLVEPKKSDQIFEILQSIAFGSIDSDKIAETAYLDSKNFDQELATTRYAQYLTNVEMIYKS